MQQAHDGCNCCHSSSIMRLCRMSLLCPRGFATLGKAKQVDPTYKRTILIRNKLDK